MNKITVTNDMLGAVEMALNYPLPKEIRSFYVGLKRTSNDLTSTIENVYSQKSKPSIIIQISSNLAKRVISNFLKLSSREISDLDEAINCFDKESLQGFDNTLSYLLIDGVNFYDVNTNKFQLPIINRAYEDIESNRNELKIIMLTWAHCGGWGGLILNGIKAGFDGGGMHGHYLEVEHEGQKYEYNSNFYEHMEKHHLIEK